VSHPAGDNEDAKANEHPIEGQVAASADELNEGERNREVSDGDEEIGDKMKPDQARIPKVTMPVGHEAVVAKEVGKEIHAQLRTIA
jgi:hypothetical protein